MAEQPIEDSGGSEHDDDIDADRDSTGATSPAIRTAFKGTRTTEARPTKSPEKPEVIPGGAET